MPTEDRAVAVQRALVDAVREMRRLQKAWFAGDKSVRLNSAKTQERRVDQLLAELDGSPPPQSELF